MSSLFRSTFLIMQIFLVIIIFFFFSGSRSTSNRALRQEIGPNPNEVLGLIWPEERERVKERQIQKSPGEEEGKRKLRVLRKVGAFLGLNHHDQKVMQRLEEIGPSPAAAPRSANGGGDVAETPSPVLPFFTNKNSHRHALRPALVFHELSIPRSETDGSGIQVGRGAIAAVVSAIGTAAAIFIMVFFGFSIFRRKKQRPVRALLLPGFWVDSGSEKPKTRSLLNFATNDVFDQGPEHFYLSTLCELKQKSGDNPNVMTTNSDDSFGQDQVNRSSSRNQFPLHCDGVVLELASVEELAFHSACGSQSSSGRVSDASNASSGASSLSSHPLDSPRSEQLPPGGLPLSPSCRGATPESASVSPLRLKPSPSPSSLNSPSPIAAPQDEAPPAHSANVGHPPVDCRSGTRTPPPPPPPLPRSPFSRRVPPPPLPKGLRTTETKLVSTSQHEQSGPAGNTRHRRPKLKPLHWDKVRAAPDHSMVWDELRGGSFEFDEQMIESLFWYNMRNSSLDAEVGNRSSSLNKHILDPKRLQNITILSKAVNASPEQVCNALIHGDGLAVEQLEALAKMAPTKEEEERLSNYIGDTSELGFGERFVKEILNLPLAFSGIEAMLYKETFDDEVHGLRKLLVMVEDACKELKSSPLFLKLLEAVLKTGNRMNDGTTRGGAKAFKLDALLKLADVKGTDGKTTLLHFVVQEIIRSEGVRTSDIKDDTRTSEFTEDGVCDEYKCEGSVEIEERYRSIGLDLASRLSKELSSVKKTAGVDLDVLAGSVLKLSERQTKLRSLIQEDILLMDDRAKEFVKMMKSFLGLAEDEIKKLQQDEKRVLHMVRQITEYFHGDMSKDEANPLHIFVIVGDFLRILDQVCKDINCSKPSSSR
ncbi:formin-like protein 11 isoform X1 [Nymphaea colorata]|nr:formin-like protein 11 isoform X1 [Nymphaea colorata]